MKLLSRLLGQLKLNQKKKLNEKLLKYCLCFEMLSKKGHMKNLFSIPTTPQYSFMPTICNFFFSSALEAQSDLNIIY